jgi:iron complex outermembrane receptor protein
MNPLWTHPPPVLTPRRPAARQYAVISPFPLAGRRQARSRRVRSSRRFGAAIHAFKNLLCVLMSAGLVPLTAGAEEARTLADLSIEELMFESVTSASQKEQKLGDVATAISVLTNEDLRRSGATSIAEALRLVPGLAVSSFNASEWAISARGFHSLYANKLLVLVDGRAVYTPLFAGVYWDLQQAMLEDIDRIEVIRGPGATMWGANAVTGVVNVASRSAKDTQGGLAYGAGQRSASGAGARYGGRIGAQTYYRVFASQQSTGDHLFSDGQRADDGRHGVHGGARLDHYLLPDTHVTWQADLTSTRFDHENSDAGNVNMLGRWTRQFSARSSIEAQAYVDRTHRNESTRVRSTLDTADFSLHHTFGLGERNDVVWGVGYRHMGNVMEQTSRDTDLRDHRFGLQLVSAFAQNEFKLVPRVLSLTAGTKIEHNDFTGLELQPSVRAVFKPASRHSIWAAISRAVRTPDVIEGRDAVGVGYGAPAAGPGGMLLVPMLVGNPAITSEIQVAYEAGYRAQFSPRVSFDLAAYYNDYDRLIGYGTVERIVPALPVGFAEIPWANNLSGNTHGAEVAFNVAPVDGWRLAASYTLLVAHIRGPAHAEPMSMQRNFPEHQAMLRSFCNLTARAGLDAQLRYVDSIPGAPAYFTADLRFSYKLTAQIEIAVLGRNLVDRRHPEQPATAFGVVSEVPRTVSGKMTWHF